MIVLEHHWTFFILLVTSVTGTPRPITTFFTTHHNPRDFQLSHNQQTEILSDIQRHQPVIYSHQLFNRQPFLLSPTTAFHSEPPNIQPVTIEEQNFNEKLSPAVEVEFQHSITDPEQIKKQLQEAEKYEKERALEFARIAKETAERIAKENAKRKAENEAKRREIEKAIKLAEENAKKVEEENARRAENARRITEENKRKVAEEHARKIAEENARRIAEENARKIAEEEEENAIKAAEQKRKTPESEAKTKDKPKLRVVDVLPEEQLFLQKERQKLYDQLKQTHIQEIQEKENLQVEQSQSVKSTAQRFSNHLPKSDDEREQEKQVQLLQKQFQSQLQHRQELLKKLKQALGDGDNEQATQKYYQSSSRSSPNYDILSSFRQVSTTPKYEVSSTPKYEVSSTPKYEAQSTPRYEIFSSLQPFGDAISTVVSKPTNPPQIILDQLTKGVLPLGAEFEVIRQKQDGGLEEVPQGKIPQGKKVTLVFLEEQPDGTVKIQSVKGNGNEEGPADAPVPDVNTLIQKIQEGKLKLPPSVRLAPSSTTAKPFSTTRKLHFLPTVSQAPVSRPPPPPPPQPPSPVPVLSPQSTEEIIVSSTPRPTRLSESSRLQEIPLVEKHQEEDGKNLTRILKREGLYAMAKYLRESGLDNILNDTGPYTIFAPTDKAFRSLLVQLGGPERADEKFRENPRLLSGLLLHHVIPGAFELDSLQDEMTGVSLAGTQLRVNMYTTQDVEWNEIKTVTINGARVSRDKHDMPIPQGIAHAVDRVMFPLPVGTILQTLSSDREGRFNTFLEVIKAAGLTEFFTGNKVHTVFAPTEQAFAVLLPEELQRLLGDEATARAFVLRHVTTSTAYTAGMRFYHIRDSLDREHPLTINKAAGQLKVNGMLVISPNIPATNGVIHALDGLL